MKDILFAIQSRFIVTASTYEKNEFQKDIADQINLELGHTYAVLDAFEVIV